MIETEWNEPTPKELGMTLSDSWKSVKPQEVVDAIHGKNTPEARRRMVEHEAFMKRWRLK